MNETIIQKWNSVVSENDDIYHLGDFGFGSFEKLSYIYSRLQGKKYLIKGNHCDQAVKLPWIWVKDYHELKYNNMFFCMMHYPIKIWNGRHHGSICLGGHSHLSTNTFEQRYMDVGVDANNYTPINLNDIITKMSSVTNFKSSRT